MVPSRPMRWRAARTALAMTVRPWLASVPMTMGSVGAPASFTSFFASVMSAASGEAGAVAASSFWAAVNSAFW